MSDKTVSVLVGAESTLADAVKVAREVLHDRVKSARIIPHIRETKSSRDGK